MSRLVYGPDVDVLSFVSLHLELNDAVRFCEEGMVVPHPDVIAGEELCTPLPDDDIARPYGRTAVTFNAEPSAGTIPAVSCRSLPFFMSHFLLLLRLLY